MTQYIANDQMEAYNVFQSYHYNLG